MNRSCVALISGGLDSSLAARLMLEQGIQVHGLYLSMSWGCCEKEKAQAAARQLGIPLMVLGVGEAYLDVIRRPKYGYGSGMNPCVDCRIYMFRIAKRYMEELDAGFVVTGEVLGQRPMSQRRQPLDVIQAESGLEGRLLRPLCAQLLEPTLPELLGVVDRQRMLDFCGRTRQPQLALAAQQGITEFSTPAGGCLLTDEQFARKVKDLFAHEERPTTKDMELLTVGRHYRIAPSTKVILGRNAVENLMLEGHADPSTRAAGSDGGLAQDAAQQMNGGVPPASPQGWRTGYTCIRPKFSGPSALLVGACTPEHQRIAVALILKFTKEEKLPDGRLDFWVNGAAWSTEPEITHARPDCDNAAIR